MKFINDKILRDNSVSIFMEYGKDGVVPYLKSLEARISELEKETPKKVGRPRKQNATNEA
jgi:hypothetical protein